MATTFEFQAQIKCVSHDGNVGLLNDVQELLSGVPVNEDRTQTITRVAPMHGDEVFFCQASIQFEEDGRAFAAAVQQAAIARLAIEGSSSIWLKADDQETPANDADLFGWGLAAT